MEKTISTPVQAHKTNLMASWNVDICIVGGVEINVNLETEVL